MGTFGFEVFDDDMACDALAYVQSMDKPFEKFEQCFDSVLTEEYIDSEEAQEALAYSMIMIAFIDMKKIDGRSDQQLGVPYRERVVDIEKKFKDQWASYDQKPLVKKCIDALERIKKPQVSELYDLWNESDGIDGWYPVVDGIIADLS
ncbi:hypothetical protein CLIB1444_03S01332 [[Candida] jaroonii]|uniref:Uncharacterized protein n=1 Tax=[Candida] jaroonii TaxID=467808 RepID=A0ACA9Y4Q4_9ASCO|nr:hypothetical protein CLIB1444_03S01332 [[Candida] jaroonii]